MEQTKQQKISSDMIKEGMFFSAPVFFDDGKNMFLAEKKAVTRFHVDTLKRWSIPYVLTYGRQLSEKDAKSAGSLTASSDVEDLDELEELDELDEADVPKSVKSKNEPVKTDVIQKAVPVTAGGSISSGTLSVSIQHNPLYIEYENLYKKITVLFSSIKDKKFNNMGVAIDALVAALIKFIEKDVNLVVSFLFTGNNKVSNLARSSLHTVILTYLIASKMGCSKKTIVHYVTGALLHDSAMLALPEYILNKKQALTQEEFSLLKMHTIEGYSFVCGGLMYPREVGNIVQQHHERWDGLGYPNGLRGEDIDKGALIVAVADAFEAMCTQKPYRNSVLGYEAMKKLIGDNGRHFSPDVIKVFIQSMGIYPIGSLVLLNSGAIARIAESNSVAPLRPKVHILIDKDGKKSNSQSAQLISLEEEKKLFIIRALDSTEANGFL